MANSQTIWQFVACFRNDSVHSHNVPKLQCPQGTAHELRPARRINCCRLVRHCDVVSGLNHLRTLTIPHSESVNTCGFIFSPGKVCLLSFTA